MAVVVTVAKGYDLAYIWKTQGEAAAGRTTGGYYITAAQAGEPPGRWWGPGAQALGLTVGRIVQRMPYGAVYQQIDPRTGTQLGRPRPGHRTDGFKSMRDALSAAAPNWTFGGSALCGIQGHPAYVPRSAAGSVYGCIGRWEDDQPG